jgi:transcriptional accessory protein Tex/SPT6
MSNIPQILAQELSLKPFQVENALQLFSEGATIPFVARYRKEVTGLLDEIQLRDISERYTYLTELEDRKKSILEAIASQEKLTDELREKIETCLQKTELEDLYLPYKPKRRTRATVAKEKGLEPLAQWIANFNQPNSPTFDLNAEAQKYISEEKGVKTVEEALNGASDILAEIVSEKANLRAYLREYLMNRGVFVSLVKDDYPEGTTKFEMYRQYRENVQDIRPHNLLALLRGETEGILKVEMNAENTGTYITLCNSSKKAITNEISSSTISDTKIFAVKKGTYYLKVTTNSYWLRMKTSQESATDQSGSSKSKAANLTLGKDKSGLIFLEDKSSKYDWFKFTLTKATAVDLEISGSCSAGTIYYELTSSSIDGTLEGYLSGVGSYDETPLNYYTSDGKIHTSLPKGTYYIKVYKKSAKSCGTYFVKAKKR